jgi:hypothetical protein
MILPAMWVQTTLATTSHDPRWSFNDGKQLLARNQLSESGDFTDAPTIHGETLGRSVEDDSPLWAEISGGGPP